MSDAVSIMRVDIGDTAVVVDATTICEVLGRTSITSIPGPTGLIGIIPWGGRALAVLDIAPFIGATSDIERPRTLVVTLDDAIVAVPIDRVYEPRPASTIRSAHAMRTAFVHREVEIDGMALPVFDIASLLASFDGVKS